jgi:hypothetical protein
VRRLPGVEKIDNPYSSVTPVTSDGETARVYSRHHWADGFARLISLPDESPLPAHMQDPGVAEQPPDLDNGS